MPTVNVPPAANIFVSVGLVAVVSVLASPFGGLRSAGQEARSVGRVQLRDELESLRADVERRDVEGLEVRAITRRVDDCRANRRLGRKNELVVLGEFGIFVHLFSPVRRFESPPIAIDMPTGPAGHAVDLMHVLVCHRIVERHCRGVGTGRVEISTAWVEIARKTGHRPAQIGRLLPNQKVDFPVGRECGRTRANSHPTAPAAVAWPAVRRSTIANG